MNDSREQRTQRDRQAGADIEAGRLDTQEGMPPAPMLVQTKTVGTYPTAAGSYFAVAPVDPGGIEGEGNDGTFAVGSETFYALNVGNLAPPVGTKLIAEPVGGRWLINFYA